MKVLWDLARTEPAVGFASWSDQQAVK